MDSVQGANVVPFGPVFIAIFVSLQCTPLIVAHYGSRPSWTRADSTGRYALEFAASVALGLDSRAIVQDF